MGLRAKTITPNPGKQVMALNKDRVVTLGMYVALLLALRDAEVPVHPNPYRPPCTMHRLTKTLCDAEATLHLNS